ncbi:MAG: hypothetical protein JWL59_1330 [Chthoniobacteraceae bacterium]|nr:hypothetical protein [Chthoniobacteraceae bacterium]
MSACSAIHFHEPRFGKVQISLHDAQGLVIDPVFVTQINERLMLDL